MALWILRISLYAQFLLGLDRYLAKFAILPASLVVPARVWDWHLLLGIVIALLALYRLRPIRGISYNNRRMIGRFLPLLPLILGIGFRFGLLEGIELISIHALLGLLVIALVEMCAAQERRALRRKTAFL